MARLTKISCQHHHRCPIRNFSDPRYLEIAYEKTNPPLSHRCPQSWILRSCIRSHEGLGPAGKVARGRNVLRLGGSLRTVRRIRFPSSCQRSQPSILTEFFFCSLQITTGIIAACAPTLKPLVGRALRLNSSDNSSGPYKHSKSSKQRPRILGPFSIPPSVNQTDFALTRSDSFPPRQDLERGQVTSQAEYFNKSVHISYYGYPESDSGDYSERSSQHMKQHDGILCTKEIIIHR